jgi:hypothetical protein
MVRGFYSYSYFSDKEQISEKVNKCPKPYAYTLDSNTSFPNFYLVLCGLVDLFEDVNQWHENVKRI